MIRLLPKSAWRYAIIIVALFAIAAFTSNLVITHLEKQIVALEREDLIWQLNASIWLLTMGFMFLSGALGLWAIRSTVDIESRRRIGRFVDAMDYLSDGLFVIDNRDGVIMGANPALKRLVPDAYGPQPTNIYEAFPFLNLNDVESLVQSAKPREIYADYACQGGLRSLRFRSQPSEGIILIFVSDITETRSQEIRQRQIARLQLVGRIAGGVASDFSNILCSISGHVALLERLGDNPDQVRNSLNIITTETKRGSHLSKMLLDLSRSGEPGNPSNTLDDDVRKAGALLRIALSPGWVVRTSVDGKYGAVPLTPAQIGQVVLNLGLLAADAQPKAGTVMITLNPPGHEHLLSVGENFSAVILISAHASSAQDVLNMESSFEQAIPILDETGVILSVVRSIVDEVGGQVNHLSFPDGLSIYRVCLTSLNTTQIVDHKMFFPRDELSSYVSRWHILFSASNDKLSPMLDGLRMLGTIVDKKSDIGSLLAGLQSEQKLDAIVLDYKVLGAEPENVLDAIARLAPHAGILVLCSGTEAEPLSSNSPAVFEKDGATPSDIIRAMVEAKARRIDHGSISSDPILRS